MNLEWMSGLPTVPIGAQKDYWVAYEGHSGRTYYERLFYSNQYKAQLSDDADAPGDMEPDDDGYYSWTGWFKDGCENCDSDFTPFELPVLAWIELPAFETGSAQPPASSPVPW